MEIGTQILFFLAALGVFNGVLLAGYFLFFTKPRRWVNLLFGLLMLMLCIRIGKSLFHIFTDLDRIYKQIGLSACMMIGPFLFLYVRNFLEKVKAPSRIDFFHIGIPLFTILTIGVIWPYETDPEVWNSSIVNFIYSVWVLYMLGITVTMIPLIQKAFKKQTTIGERWILLVYGCILTLCIAYVLALFRFPYLAGPLLFSLVLYLLMGFLASKTNRSLIIKEEPVKYQNQKLSKEKSNDLLLRLAEKMQTEHSYLNNKIKLAQVASSIDSTPHEVSQVINNRLGISFNNYINEFRIKAACKLLKESDHLTIEGIGQEVGFKSKSAFYAAFKLQTDQTPAQYKTQLKISK